MTFFNHLSVDPLWFDLALSILHLALCVSPHVHTMLPVSTDKSLKKKGLWPINCITRLLMASKFTLQ